ncbi:DUF2309 domain-containing protein [Salinibacter sp. 10B]|uniref:DUF2309 domain-containing protein n=1 Tax=Salinibacter sp. 10B TaxID=1923971 RepID=UPI000CF58023|nr:DUF2309 domain-containing protein [Salinibacter sp. 10B]PQJ34103.1 DUF2309 domain-containing protein [Salinibacter sp. 10B]
MPIERSVLRARIENAAEYIGPLWPLQTFNAANPLVGFEDQSFDQAVQQARQLLGGRGYPHPSVFRQAWENDEIDPEILTRHLADHGITQRPEVLLDRMESDDRSEPAPPSDEPLDRVTVKWLSAFLDQGQAAWPMPKRSDGFYAAWRAVAPYDNAVPSITRTADLPDTLLEAFEEVLASYPEKRWESIFVHHLAALPGWTGFIKWRARRGNTEWQEAYPITLADYLAVRLILATHLDAAVTPDRAQDLPANGTDRPFLPQIWLRAWEKSYRDRLLDTLAQANKDPQASRDRSPNSARPDAQFAFCIDVRSEIIRRHIEDQGAYETHGYAGFFGVPMQHQPYGAETTVKSCPPIVDPKHRIIDRPADNTAEAVDTYGWWTALETGRRHLVKTLKSNVAAAFGFVEGSGGFFGGAMAARTLLPSALFRLGTRLTDWIPQPTAFTEPTVDRPSADDADWENGLPVGLSHEAKVLYAEAAFRLMGWTDRFAPLVIFTGHGTQTPNNPYKSSLDCGACSGNPGGPNARVLAAICNEDAVQNELREREIDIPDDTVFLAGQHNTTTDEITLFVDDRTPTVPSDALAQVKDDLKAAQAQATTERVRTMNATVDSGQPRAAVRETERRAADWAETRPEWGLAGNASFIIGPRRLTETVDLDGRAFLHSYDWATDEDGTALENIMTGPLVVGEWINTQYYFSTVDNAAYGSGSKVTQNVVGKVGIVQGNGGDLMTGLPLQSLQIDDEHPFHRPLRLLTIIHAPTERVDAVLDRHASLVQLLDHEWIHLTIMDPTQNNRFFHYEAGKWTAHTDASHASAEPALAARTS